jgi:hypothetical protein
MSGIFPEFGKIADATLDHFVDANKTISNSARCDSIGCIEATT